MDNHWPDIIKKLESFKNGIDGRSIAVSQIAYSLQQYIKDIFPINGVPIRIEKTIDCLKDRLELSEQQFELTIDIIINEIEINQVKINGCEN
jgi:hypothetical protein